MKIGGKFISEWYFGVYQAQIPPTILIYNILKLGSIFNIADLNMFLITMNALFITITALFTYLSIKKLNNHKSALLTLIFFILNPIFYLYVSYCYTDTLCMPFAMIAIYLYILSRKSKKTIHGILLLLISGFFIALGYEIRAVIIILLIAMLVEMFIRNKFSKKLLINLSSLIIGFLITIVLVNQIIKIYDAPKNNDTKFSALHWIMMGLNDEADGGWTSSDYSYTLENKTAEDKKQADIKMIKKRISKLGPNGYISLVKIKLSRTWSNGNYSSWSHLSVFEKMNKLYEYVNGSKRIFLVYYEQICKVTILAMLLISVIAQIKGKYTEHKFIFIAIFGAFLFYILWEAMDRYSLSFLPWLFLIFDIGIIELEKIISIKNIKMILNENKNKNIDLQRIYKILSILVIAITIVLLGINYISYVKTKTVYYNNVIVQNKMTGGKLNKISTRKVEQYFTTDKKFDTIILTFIKDNNVNSSILYNFVLYNSNKNELYKKTFTSDDFKNYGTVEFNFPEVKPNKKEKYSFMIYTDEVKESESIGIVSYYYKDYNLYKEGKLYVDNALIKDGNLEFWVKNKVKRKYISAKLYILICISIVGIELFAFYPYLKRKNINN